MNDVTNTTNTTTIFARVVVVPGAVTEVALNLGDTVAAALSAAGVTAGPNQSISLNGAAVDTSASVADGDRIVISTSAKSAG
jgi:hypothetical protein